MFYRDFILTVERGDRLFFMTQLVTLLHEKHSQLPVGLAFPEWQDGKPVRVDDFDTRRNHANLGATIRLFSEHADVLESAVRVLNVDVLIQKRVLHVTPVKPAPTCGTYAAFCRVRTADSLHRRSRRVTDQAARLAMEDKVAAAAHTTAYFVMSNQQGNSQRSMYITKVTGSARAESLSVNSFGFSSQSTPCFLPDF